MKSGKADYDCTSQSVNTHTESSSRVALMPHSHPHIPTVSTQLAAFKRVGDGWMEGGRGKFMLNAPAPRGSLIHSYIAPWPTLTHVEGADTTLLLCNSNPTRGWQLARQLAPTNTTLRLTGTPPRPSAAPCYGPANSGPPARAVAWQPQPQALARTAQPPQESPAARSP